MKLVILCAIFCIAIFVAPSLVDNQGYVFISAGNYTIESSVVVAVGIIILTFILLLLGYQFLRWIISCRKLFSGFFDRRREVAARENLYLGIIALLEQRYSEAHKLLIQNTHSNHRSVASYIIAAQAAIQTKNEKNCLNALEKVQKLEPRALLACLILKADLYASLGNYVKSVEILEKARVKYENNPVVYRKLANLCVKLGDFKKLREIIPYIKACKAFPFDDFLQLQFAVYKQDLQNIDNLVDLNELWNKVSRSLKKQPVILGLFARKFAEVEDSKMAEKIFIEGLRKFNEKAVLQEIYTCNISLPKLLAKLEAAYDNPEKQKNVDLLRALANQYFAGKDYCLALEYFKKIVEIGGINDDYKKIVCCYESTKLSDKSNLNLNKVSV